jgi:hypothetical protein
VWWCEKDFLTLYHRDGLHLHATELGERILSSYPSLHSADDDLSPLLSRMLRLDELALAYAITIHKSQGSEFPAVVIPLAKQHYMLLQRNLIYTGITRGKRLLVLVGQRKALGIAVRNDRPQRRYSGPLFSLRGNRRAVVH